jgi:hypothetical protein
VNGSVYDAVADLLATTAYHRCLILVHADTRRLEAVANELKTVYAWPRLNVGRELAAFLLSDLPAHRSDAARRWLETFLASAQPGPVLLSEIDLLFEPTLHLDVLILLRQASRTTRLVVAWPGSLENGTLAYAVPEHHHYRTWLRPEVSIVTLD